MATEIKDSPMAPSSQPKKLGLASLILGITGFIPFIGALLAAIGLVLAIIGLIRKAPDKTLNIAGFAISIISLTFSTFGIVGAIELMSAIHQPDAQIQQLPTTDTNMNSKGGQ